MKVLLMSNLYFKRRSWFVNGMLLCFCLTVGVASAQDVGKTAELGAHLQKQVRDGVAAVVPGMERLAPMEVQPPDSSRVVRDPVQPGPPLREPDTAWIESTLASMTMDEKIGQMIMPGYSSSSSANVNLINNFHVGGFIVQGNTNTASSILNGTNALQAVTSVPLIFSTDCEAGLGARFLDATRFPLNMGAAAAGDLELIREQGKVTARECRAIGIQIGFGPVVDINTEPINPIIGTRSYGDNPTSAALLAQAYVEGANSEGLLCTFKHYPGHGATTGDSHEGLQTVSISVPDLMANHVSPYAQLINQGIGDLVMTAHVWYPALDPGSNAWPATLSTPALTNILRNQLNYDGCVISDSFAMGGLMQAINTYNGVRVGVLAGLDIILTPASVMDAFNGLKDAVVNNQIPVSRIDASVRRILALKSRAGMPESVSVPLGGLVNVGHPDNLAVAEQIGRKAIAAKLEGSVIPVQSGESLGVYILTGHSTIFYNYSSDSFKNALLAEHPGAQITSVGSTNASSRAAIVSGASQFDKILVVSMEWKPELSLGSQVILVNELVAAGKPVAYVSFGSPFQWKLFPDLENFLCGFSCHYRTQQEMAKLIVGESMPTGHWPVKLEQLDSAVTDWALY